MDEHSWLREKWCAQGLARVSVLRPHALPTVSLDVTVLALGWWLPSVFLTEFASPELAVSVGTKGVEFSLGSAENIVSEIKRKKKNNNWDVAYWRQASVSGFWALPLGAHGCYAGTGCGCPPLSRSSGESLPLCKEVPLLPLWGFPSPWSECWHHVTFLFPHPWSLSPVLTVSCANSRPWILCCGCCGCYGFGLHGGGGRDGRALFYGTGQLCIIKIMYRCESWIIKYWCFQTVMLEKTVESPLDCKEVNPKGNQPWIFIGRTCCWNWSSNTLATWSKEPTHCWCWERLKARGEGDNRGWDGWMALLTQ